MALAFAVAMAVVLAAMGAFVYARLASNLSQALDENLRLRVDDVRALVESAGGTLADAGGGLIERDERFAQLLDADGRVLDGTAGVQTIPLLHAAELEQMKEREQLFLDRKSLPGQDEPVRLLVVPVSSPDGRAVLVVGATRENRAEALRDLRNALVIAGPIALLLATGSGYRLAGAGLGVVEAMRRRAAEISATRPGERLPVPPTRDELERLGTTLNEMLDRLEQALARERGFVADAGHELRTPLALLRAELDFALQHASGEEELREAVREASEETDRLVQLAADLLLIASSDQGKLPLRLEPLEAAELFDSVRNRFLLRAQESGRVVVTEPAGVELTGDRLRLEQALGNLVDNALRHGAGVVRLQASKTAHGVELAVSDEGEGFPEGYLERAFERFSRPDEGRAGAGTGLGLAIVETIARAHDGTARASTLPGGGASVTVALPVIAASSAPPTVEPST